MDDTKAGLILGISTRHYPTQGVFCKSATCEHIVDQCGDPQPVRVVLVSGEIGDYAAYCGVGMPEWVAAHGDKISFEEACGHFPNQLEKERYRR